MLGDEIAWALPELRAHAESRMGATNGGSTVNVRRRTGQTTEAPNGLEVDEWATIHPAMPCLIRNVADNGSTASRTLDVGDGVKVQTATRVASFPTSISQQPVDPDLADGDLIEVTAGALAGRVYRIVESDPADQTTARNVPVVATPRPTEWED